MAIWNLVKPAGRSLAVAGALAALVPLTVPTPAHAISSGAAVGLGLGSLALGTMIGSAAARPYGYYPYGGYYYAPPPAYAYPPSPAYYPPVRRCWDPYYRYYYAC